MLVDDSVNDDVWHVWVLTILTVFCVLKQFFSI
jgi:hypothetical protein